MIFFKDCIKSVSLISCMFNFFVSTFQEGKIKFRTKSTIYDTTQVNRTSLDIIENGRLNPAGNLYVIFFAVQAYLGDKTQCVRSCVRILSHFPTAEFLGEE